MTSNIFISYDKRDKSIAYKVCDYLEQLDEDYKCWIAPRDVPPGWDYPTAIIRAIRNTRIVILILSKHSNTSQMVNREIERAVASDLPIIPFRIEEIELSENMEFYISSTQWLDAFPPPIEDHFQKLKNAIPLSSFRNVMVEKEGFCILCRKPLPIAEELMEIMQYCKDCYYKYANEINIGYGIKYENLYCHYCGEKADLSENEITCEKCKSRLPIEHSSGTLFIEEEVSFRGTIIQESEAAFLREIENDLNQQFTGDKLSVLMEIPSWEREIFIDENEILFLVEDKRVIKLSVREKTLTNIPESIENLEHLIDLDLSDNQLESLPESISNLSYLKVLDLRNNGLRSLPESMGELKGLEYLYLASNQLNELPSSLIKMTLLREIDLEDNPLNEQSILFLKKLRDQMKDNIRRIVRAVKQIPAERLYKLLHSNESENLDANLNNKSIEKKEIEKKKKDVKREYVVSFREGTHIPETEAIFIQEIEVNLNKAFKVYGHDSHDDRDMTISIVDDRITELFIPNKSLKTIPETIGNLEELLHLDLYGNQLESLPESIGNLSQLGILQLSNNKITSLPESIGDLDNLIDLYLNNNLLTELPYSLTQLNSLEELQVKDNPLSESSKKILDELRDSGKTVLY